MFSRLLVGRDCRPTLQWLFQFDPLAIIPLSYVLLDLVDSDESDGSVDNDQMLFDETDWMAYREANAKFAEAVMDICQSGDLVWVQDYHRESCRSKE